MKDRSVFVRFVVLARAKNDPRISRGKIASEENMSRRKNMLSFFFKWFLALGGGGDLDCIICQS